MPNSPATYSPVVMTPALLHLEIVHDPDELGLNQPDIADADRINLLNRREARYQVPADPINWQQLMQLCPSLELSQMDVGTLNKLSLTYNSTYPISVGGATTQAQLDNVLTGVNVDGSLKTTANYPGFLAAVKGAALRDGSRIEWLFGVSWAYIPGTEISGKGTIDNDDIASANSVTG